MHQHFNEDEDVTPCPDNCDNGTLDYCSCPPGCYCGGCTTEYECETCAGRGDVCECGERLEDEYDFCEECGRDEDGNRIESGDGIELV